MTKEKDFLKDARLRHDIKANLNSIMGFAELIKDNAFGKINNPRYQDYITYIYNSSHKINNIINAHKEGAVKDKIIKRSSLEEIFINEDEFAKSLYNKSYFIEKDDDDKNQINIVSCLEDNSIFVSVSTVTAYNLDLVNILSEILRKKASLSNEKTENFKQILAEVIPNAVVHGNLSIESLKSNEVEAFFNYNKKIKERLQNPEYCKKKIVIKVLWNEKILLCSVLDEGEGHNEIVEIPLITAASGRGLFIISSISDAVWFKHHGREINFAMFLDKKNKELFTYKKEKDYLKNLTLMSDVHKSKILIVDDDDTTRLLFKEILGKSGFSNVLEAQCGLECLRQAITNKPDLIILDIDMKLINGFEILEHIRNIDSLQNIPILIQTGFGTKDVIEEVFKKGASDYISKPINNNELISRIKIHLQNRLLIKTLGTKLSTIETDIGVASRMQQDLLPKKEDIKDIETKMNFKIFNHFEPSAFLGGDLWDIFQLSQDKFAVYLVDFSGHGVSGSLNTFRLKSILSQINLRISKPSEVLRHINNALFEQLALGNFATFVYAIFDNKSSKLTYSTAGSPDAFIGINNGNGLDMRFLENKSLPLGIKKNHKYEDYEVDFPKGSFWLAYSDALYESKTVDDGFIEQKDFYNAFNANKDIIEAVNSLKNSLLKPISDDLTIVMTQNL